MFVGHVHLHADAHARTDTRQPQHVCASACTRARELGARTYHKTSANTLKSEGSIAIPCCIAVDTA